MPERRFRTLLAACAATLIAAPTMAGDIITEDRTIQSDDVEPGDGFGTSVAIDAGVVVVGASGDDDNGMDAGAVYLFDASTGAQLHKLLADEGAPGDRFGDAVAIADGIVAVGAPLAGDDPVSGAAYLFDAVTGAQLFELIPEDGLPDARFGRSIAIDQGIVAVGAPNHAPVAPTGAVYLFDATTGEQIDMLDEPDDSLVRQLGWSVAMDDGLLVAGAPNSLSFCPGCGEVQVFDVASGRRLRRLVPYFDAEPGNTPVLGTSVDIEAGTVASGTPLADASDGGAYLFRSATTLDDVLAIPRVDASETMFGSSIALSVGVIVSGAPNDDANGTDAGAVLAFDTSGTPLATFLASDGAPDQQLGRRIAVDGRTLVVARDFVDVEDAGSVYMFTVPDPEDPDDPCPSDITGDGLVDFIDLLTLLSDWGACVP